MQKYLLLFIFLSISMLFTKFSNAEIKIKNYYTCDSIKYPKYSFGLYLKKNSSAKVYKINKKKFIYHEIQYVDYKTFLNLKLKEFIGKNINLIEDDATQAINFYGESEGKYLGGCIKTKDEIGVKCKLINFDLISRKKKPIDC